MYFSATTKGQLIFHSDPANQYTNKGFRSVFEKHSISTLMSRHGNRWDNAVGQMLFGSLKEELLPASVFRRSAGPRMRARNWLHRRNQRRKHSILNYVRRSSTPFSFSICWYC